MLNLKMNTFLTVYGRFAYESFRQISVCQLLKSFRVRVGQFPNCFHLISGWKNEVYTCVSHYFVAWLRERIIYLRSARFAS